MRCLRAGGSIAKPAATRPAEHTGPVTAPQHCRSCSTASFEHGSRTAVRWAPPGVTLPAADGLGAPRPVAGGSSPAPLPFCAAPEVRAGRRAGKGSSPAAFGAEQLLGHAEHVQPASDRFGAVPCGTRRGSHWAPAARTALASVPVVHTRARVRALAARPRHAATPQGGTARTTAPSTPRAAPLPPPLPAARAAV